MSEPHIPAYDGLPEAKRLLRTIRAGTLATLTPEGGPFASLVSVATLVEGHPVLLLSRLAAHTQHLLAEPRCSLLLAQGGKGDPLAHPRLTLTGRAHRLAETDAAVARDRFLSRQPKAALYAGFPDFGFWRIDLEGAHVNGGFARAASFAGEALLAEAGDLGAAERSAVAHMNADHTDALRLYATVLAKAGDGAWVVTGLDPDGLDLACGDRVARIAFDMPVHEAGVLRGALKALADRARAAATTPEPDGAAPSGR